MRAEKRIKTQDLTVFPQTNFLSGSDMCTVLSFAEKHPSQNRLQQ